MSRIEARLAQLERARPPEPFKAAMSFLWASPDDDMALQETERIAAAEGRILIISRLVPPYEPGEAHGINTGLLQYV